MKCFIVKRKRLVHERWSREEEEPEKYEEISVLVYEL